MKKIYIKPDLNIVLLSSDTSFLAGSVNGTLSDEVTNTAYVRPFGNFMFDDLNPDEEIIVTTTQEDEWDDFEEEEDL